MVKQFKPAMITAVFGLILGGLVGALSHSPLIGLFMGICMGMFSTVILSSLESSMSLDNSVVASSILINMEDKWRRRYLTYGMLIAVFGMRFLFPNLIVSMASHMSPWATMKMAIYNPSEYGRILASVHNEITAYGGSFLIMIFLTFFMNIEKDEHWIHCIEAPLSRMGKMKSLPSLITVLTTIWYGYQFSGHERELIWMSGLAGLVSYFLIKDGLPAILGEDFESKDGKKGGLGSFLYLEAVDASFSFDGVIGAFAITNNIFLIAIGLGIGAMVVRCMTLWLVSLKEKNAEEDLEIPALRFVEPGAFFSIGALVFCMYKEVPDYITGFSGIVLIGSALLTGIFIKEAEDEEEATEEKAQEAKTDTTVTE